MLSRPAHADCRAESEPGVQVWLLLLLRYCWERRLAAEVRLAPWERLFRDCFDRWRTAVQELQTRGIFWRICGLGRALLQQGEERLQLSQLLLHAPAPTADLQVLFRIHQWAQAMWA